MEIQDLVVSLVNVTTTNIFLTGKAGTGKTTLLHRIKSETKKNHVVVAFTAVAAINAGGVTINSFFQLPTGPIIPQKEDLAGDQTLYRYNPDKLRLIRSLELIIIDEISMVRVDLLDCLDVTLRKINLTDAPFGGIQLLLIGDPLQLPPVKDNWSLLSRYYPSPYFFDSTGLKKAGFVAVELTTVHRQKEHVFVNILNATRLGTLTGNMLEMLNQRYARILPELNERYITITTHHKYVNEINEQNLAALPGEEFVYIATITGDYPAEAAPTSETLRLKAGARVIMIKNDDSAKKAYYNGRAAHVTQLSANGITVAFIDDGSELLLAPQTWQNVKYSLDTQTDRLDETSSGSFTQYPIKLAWAITVHKSQGLTFDETMLDVSECFEPGQAYVALSRCRSLEGIVLRKPVLPQNIQADHVALRFMAGIKTPENFKEFLEQVQLNDEQRMLKSFFDFTAINSRLQVIESLNLKNPSLLFKDDLVNSLYKNVTRPAKKFLDNEFKAPGIPAARILTAADYFGKQVNEWSSQFAAVAGDMPQMTGNGIRINELLEEIIHLLIVKAEIFKALTQDIPSRQILTSARFGLAKPYKSKKSNEKDQAPLNHPALHEQLLQWRRDYSAQKSLPLHIIMADKTIRRVAEKTPRSLEQLAALPGIGPVKAKEIGQLVIDIVNAYFGTHQLF